MYNRPIVGRRSADRRPITSESSDDRPMIGRRSADTSADEKGLNQIRHRPTYRPIIGRSSADYRPIIGRLPKPKKLSADGKIIITR